MNNNNNNTVNINVNSSSPAISSSNKSYGICIIKILAVFMVIGVHFFLNTKYYNTDIKTANMMFQCIIRNIFMSCVPLFLMATGYLNRHTEYSKKFFKGLLNIIIIWLFYSVLEYFTLNIYNNTLDTITILDFVAKVTLFSACRYSWYIEMFIGLYLMSPMINNAYINFKDKDKHMFLISILLITIVPFFINPLLHYKLNVPDYWMVLYPLAYYILGKHISHFKYDFNKLCLLGILILNLCPTYILNNILGTDHNSITVVINTVVIFLLLYNINVENKYLKNILWHISSITLDIYLASSLTDYIVYKELGSILNFESLDQTEILYYMPVIVLTTITFSILIAEVRKFIIKAR